jgi:hypothetical protein
VAQTGRYHVALTIPNIPPQIPLASRTKKSYIRHTHGPKEKVSQG